MESNIKIYGGMRMNSLARNKYLRLLVALLLLTGLLIAGCTAAGDSAQNVTDITESAVLAEDGYYTAPQEVADYLHTYGHLPDNFITKKEAKALGWDSQAGNLDEVAPGMSIGGDVFGNREGLLPVQKGRTYYECDVNYTGGYRDGERLIYSDDGLIYYTADHYKSFEQLY